MLEDTRTILFTPTNNYIIPRLMYLLVKYVQQTSDLM